jgi:hypothetical protein
MRAAACSPRVNLFEVNFGDASRSLENARADLLTAATFDRLRSKTRPQRRERSWRGSMTRNSGPAAWTRRRTPACRSHSPAAEDAVTRDDLLQSLRTVLARPASARELQQRLRVPREAGHLQPAPSRARGEGAIIKLRGHRYALPG